jgi:hypothetical protein
MAGCDRLAVAAAAASGLGRIGPYQDDNILPVALGMQWINA